MLRSLCHCLSRAAAPRRPSRPSCKLAPRRARPTPRARPQREGGNVRISRMMWSHTCHNSHTQSVCTVYHIKHAFHTRLDTYNFVIADAGSHVLNGATPRRAAGEEFRTPEISSTYSCSRSPPWRGIKKPGPCSLASSLAACGPPARRRAAAAGARQVEG